MHSMMLKLSRLMMLVFLSTGSGLFAEDFLRANMDPKVNPGDDFFTHANGRWLRRNPIPRSESAWGIGNLVREELYANLRRINEHSSAAGGPVGSEQRKIGGLTPVQRYFLGYAMGWLFQQREERLRNHLLSDVHAPAKWRVNGPMANLPEFHAAFGVKPGQPMWRPADQQVKVW